MQVQVATLLLIAASVALASVVIGFAVNLTEQTVNVTLIRKFREFKGCKISF